MALRGWLSYWVLPVVSGLVWLAMLLGMLLWWIVDDHSRHLPTMSENATIAFISNIGAEQLWPLFIAGCVLTAIFLDLAFISERWLRHNGRLVPNSSMSEKVLSILSLVAAAVGTVGLICLSIFRTGRHSKLHWLFLGLFIAGYLFSAIFLCSEYQRLGMSTSSPNSPMYPVLTANRTPRTQQAPTLLLDQAHLHPRRAGPPHRLCRL